MYLAAHYTRVFKNQSGEVFIVPPQTPFEPSEGMAEIRGVRAIVLKFPLDGAISAEIELFTAEFPRPLPAIPRYLIHDPRDGKLKQIKAIEFSKEDGGRWEA